MKADDIRKNYPLVQSPYSPGDGSWADFNAPQAGLLFLREIAAQLAEQTEYLMKMHALHAETYQRNLEVNAINTRLNNESDAMRKEKHELEVAFLRKQIGPPTTPLISEPDSAKEKK